VADVDLVGAHGTVLSILGTLVDGIRDDQWQAQTPCSEWNVRQLMTHIVTGNERWAAAADGRPLDVGGAIGEGMPEAAIKARYHESSELVERAWSAPGVLERTFEGPQGPTPGAMRLSVHIGEIVTHGWDLARATGQTPAFPDDVVEMFIGFAERMPRDRPAGYPFASARDVHPSAPPIDRLAALMGREV